jgi:hypothetical protein
VGKCRGEEQRREEDAADEYQDAHDGLQTGRAVGARTTQVKGMSASASQRSSLVVPAGPDAASTRRRSAALGTPSVVPSAWR